MRIEPISFLKKNAASPDLKERIVVKPNGKVYVIESFENKERRQEAIALLKLLSFGARDESEGKILSADQVLNNISAKYLNNACYLP